MKVDSCFQARKKSLKRINCRFGPRVRHERECGLDSFDFLVEYLFDEKVGGGRNGTTLFFFGIYYGVLMRFPTIWVV